MTAVVGPFLIFFYFSLASLGGNFSSDPSPTFPLRGTYFGGFSACHANCQQHWRDCHGSKWAPNEITNSQIEGHLRQDHPVKKPETGLSKNGLVIIRWAALLTYPGGLSSVISALSRSREAERTAPARSCACVDHQSTIEFPLLLLAGCGTKRQAKAWRGITGCGTDRSILETTDTQAACLLPYGLAPCQISNISCSFHACSHN